MPLSSKLFAGDPRLEAAANVDSAHIAAGARGVHIEKIQTALNILDNAGLTVDGVYGPATAKAVLNYKTKRKIINPSYQASADDIVGKMTVMTLDEEMRAYEAKPKPAPDFQFVPIRPRANAVDAYPKLDFAMTKSKALVPIRANVLKSIKVVDLNPGEVAEIKFCQSGHRTYLISIGSATFGGEPLADMILPGTDGKPVNSFTAPAGTQEVPFKVRAGVKWGTAIIYLSEWHPGISPKFEPGVLINIKDPRPRIWHPTDAHHHQPVSEPEVWHEVCEEEVKHYDGIWDKTNALYLLAVAKADPDTVVAAAAGALLFQPMAQWHYRYYLDGAGGVVNEDANLKDWIEGDDKARSVIAGQIRAARRGHESPVSVMFEFYKEKFGNRDARNSFGTIDNLEAKADWLLGTVEVWFEDTYEWHPVYPQYTKPTCPDPGVRDTNFGHAAFVQMKRRGAKDYQMRGYASFPMRLFPGL